MSYETYKYADPDTQLLMYNLIQKMYESGVTPDKMQESHITLLHKKGSISTPANYRPITLLYSFFKIYERHLEQLLRDSTEGRGQIPQTQGGFRTNKGTIELLYLLLSTIMTDQAKFKPHTILALLDMSKAFDRVNRSKLWSTLHNLGVHPQLIQAIKSTYSNPTSRIQIGNFISKLIRLNKGIRQGSSLSPLLYILYTLPMITKAEKVSIGVLNDILNTYISILAFVDDTLLIPATLLELQTAIHSIMVSCYQLECVLNIDKTEFLDNLTEHNRTKSLSHQNILESFRDKYTNNLKTKAKYLGIIINLRSNTWSDHVSHIIQSTWKRFFFLTSRGLHSNNFSANTLMFLYKTFILTKLTYASEILTPSDYELRKLDKLQDQILAKLFKLTSSCPTGWATWETGQHKISTHYKINKLRFYQKTIKSKHTNMQQLIASPSNYLHIHISKILTSFRLQHSTDEIKAFSKQQWNELIVSAADEYEATQAKQHHTPYQLALKPELQRDTTFWPEGLPTTLLEIRANVLGFATDYKGFKQEGPFHCHLCSHPDQDHSLFHYLYQCSNAIINSTSSQTLSTIKTLIPDHLRHQWDELDHHTQFLILQGMHTDFLPTHIQKTIIQQLINYTSHIHHYI